MSDCGQGNEILLFWGKAEPGSRACHPALLHMLDVGVVARELLLAQPPDLQQHMLSMFGATGSSGLALAAALHDIGKIGPGFQDKRADLCGPLRERGYPFPRQAEGRHGKIAAYRLPTVLVEELGCPVESAAVLSQVLAAHHGVFEAYVEVLDGGRKWEDARRSVAKVLARTFGVTSLASLPCATPPDALLFAGLLTLADWLGSWEDRFLFAESVPDDLEAYVVQRQAVAREVVRELGLGAPIIPERTFAELFPGLSPDPAPNPCQEAALRVAAQLSPPMLLVVESPTGSGKTEAAQAAFASVSARSGSRGVYFALPTQATGNAMFRRMERFLDNLHLDQAVELHLLHANADLNPDYEGLRLRHVEEEGGGVVASAWFTARKRGLLASFGAGTVDQALLSVLKVRHFFLRLFGLAGKFLVLDEVHAYDAYMTEEIYRLLGWSSHCGTSTILLSATLPGNRRQRLLDAFDPGEELPADLRYPCVIGVDGTGKTVWEEIRGLEESALVLAPVICAPEDKAAEILRILRSSLVDGGCAACILNTVAEAQDVYETVKEVMADAEVVLFHSRFTLNRRTEIEWALQAAYGPKGTRPRKGIVVATQVVEQSLDVDFDCMISDLAPVDLLLQRAGRLHRHRRERPAALRQRTLHVLMPDLNRETPDFGRSKYVYFPDILARTGVLLHADGQPRERVVDIPYGVSALIEEVYRDDGPLNSAHFGPALDTWVDERLGTELAQLFAAREATLADVRTCLDDPGYLERLANDRDDERVVSSRLARPSVTLVVLQEGESLAARDRRAARELYGRSLCTDNVDLVRHFAAEDPPEAWNEIGLLRHCRPLVLTGGAVRAGNRTFTYDDEYGLRRAGKTEGK